MYYEAAGEGAPDPGVGAPIIFLHGFTLDRRMWLPQLRFFSRAEPISGSAVNCTLSGGETRQQDKVNGGTAKEFHPTSLSGRDTRQHENSHRVICPDAKGHGLSDAPLTGYSRAHRVQDLALFVDTLKIGKFHLVGLSMGGTTAIGYALKHQERLQSLTLVSTAAAGYGMSKKISALDKLAKEDGVEAARKKWKRWSLSWYKDDRRELREQLEQMMNDFSGATWRDQMRGKYPREYDMEHVSKIEIPTAIFVGALDRVFAELGEKLQPMIPNSRLITYEETGHMLNLEQPDRFNADLKVFLEEALRP